MISSINDFKVRINFNLKGHNGDRSEIFLTATIDGKRVRIFTGLLIAPQFWQNAERNEIGGQAIEGNTLSVAQNKINHEINVRLRQILAFGNEYCNLVARTDLLSQEERIEHSAQNFKRFMSAKIRGEEAIIRATPKSFIEDYISRKSNMINCNTQRRMSNGTIYNHKNALKRLLLYCEENHLALTWKLFDRRFEENFTAWMLSKNFQPNTMSAQYSIMKIWMKEAELENLITDKYYHTWRTTKHEVFNIYLTEDEIQRIYEIDFTSDEIRPFIAAQSHIEQTRDIFIIACWTALRFNDWNNLVNQTVFEENGLTVRAHKTAQTLFIPYFHYSEKEIIAKYDGKLPKHVDKSNVLTQLRLLGKLAHIDSPTSITTVEGGIEKTEIVPKYTLIGTHTARRSFATNMYLRGNAIMDITAITGHKSEENFLKYIKLTQKERALRLV